LAGLGQTSTNALAGAANQMGQNYAAGYGNIGQARASGYLGGSNALTSALGTGLNYMQNQQYINRLPIPATVGYGGAPISAATPYSTGGFSSVDPYAQFAYGSST
jgi:hypothetical protein